ncbi:efflux transporter outer membrane subunit [Vibrio mangrovi]|uniref:Efflux transporter outer membrane subunit n=1 Tax=Vibrio mangrovi TaxID=474394 RepID=A0A1Y6IZZ1_9VIBR|nr:efflux transporter outer membrane subunit [Vibrio mangrovi]MDW6002901.1 efflux transporter outer membrane subunit [Vibrio mangrovi]SMS02390.1 Multidrug resistance outer membrane protein MdtP precursor [Vibrio mangrovi]
MVVKATAFAAVVFTSVTFLFGCSVPGDIQPLNKMHTEPILAHSQHTIQNSSFQAEWPQQHWWLSFNDPQLNHLIQQSLEYSPTIQLARARLSRANALVVQADSLFDPTLSAQTYMRRSRLSRQEDYSMQGNRYSTSRGLGLDFSYSFDLWGGNRAAWEAAVDSEKAAEVDHQSARIMLSTDIVAEYVRLSNAYKLLELAKKDRSRSERIVEITQGLLEHGLTSEDRLYIAQSSLATAQQKVKKRLLMIHQIKNALAISVGQGTDIADTITPPELSLDPGIPLPEELPANLMSHRPDIIAALWRVEAASQNIKVAKSRFYPNFNLSAMAGVKSLLGDAVFTDVSRSWNVTPAISLPLFQRELKANLLERTSDYDEAVAQYNQILIGALGDIADHILTLQSIQAQLKDASQSLLLAEKSYHITEKRYQAGMGSQLEVLRSEQQLLLAESELIDLKNQREEVKISLVRSLGGGYQSSASSETKSVATTYMPVVNMSIVE